MEDNKMTDIGTATEDIGTGMADIDAGGTGKGTAAGTWDPDTPGEVIELETQAEPKNELELNFQRTYTFAGQTYESIDLSGLRKLRAKDLIEASREMENGGTRSFTPEMTIENACILAAKAVRKPVEFFQWMPLADAVQLKNIVVNFLYGVVE